MDAPSESLGQAGEGLKPTLGLLSRPPSDAHIDHVIRPNLEGEKRTLYAYVQVDLAHTVMLARQGVITAEEARKILPALREIDDLGPAGFPTNPKFGSLLFQVEKFLVERIGEEVGGRMHTGRSRVDQGTAVNRLFARDRLHEILERLLHLQDALLSLARDHAQTLMPAYTHLQHAQPTTFGHYLLRHYSTFERDQQRIEAAFARTNLSALGGAAGVGTSWPLDRDMVGRLLGHEGLVENAADAGDFARDYPAENAAVLSILVNDLGRLASDLYLFSTWEFGMVEIADELSGMSSIMPQKKNAVVLERIRGLAGLAIGWLPATLGSLHSTSASDLDLMFSPDPIGEFSAATVDAIELMRATLTTLEVKEEVMRERSGIFWTTASQLADVIVRETGVSFRTAHHAVARLVGTAIGKGIRPDEVTGTMLDNAAEKAIGRRLGLSDEMVRSALDPDQFVRSLATVGSASPEAVESMLRDGERHQGEHRDWYQQKEELLDIARAKLNSEIDALVGGS